MTILSILKTVINSCEHTNHGIYIDNKTAGLYEYCPDCKIAIKARKSNFRGLTRMRLFKPDGFFDLPENTHTETIVFSDDNADFVDSNKKVENE